MLRPRVLAALAAGCGILWTVSAGAATPLATVRIAAGLQRPIWAGSPPGDARIFIVENRGMIKLMKNGMIQATPFINLAGKVSQSGNERGLLGFAFDPDFANNGRFYVNYTASASAHATIVERYTVSSTNPDVADPNSATLLLGPVTQPQSNHNGGHIEFGLDGYLYVGLGDGGGAGDTPCNAQKGNTLLGKLLRLDVNAGGAAPITNPFVGNPSFDDRIWAYGLRNPWRFAFDPANGDLYIADVGQNAREEVNYVPGTSTGGENYGWKMMEGNACFGTGNCPTGIPACNAAALTDPIRDYTHAGGNCSVTGGRVYRGCAIPDLQGTYFYADHCSDKIWSFRVVGGQVTEFTDRTAELKPSGGTIIEISSFGEDANGELFICELNGEVFKIVPAAPAPAMDLANGKVGGNGAIPRLEACGLLDAGNTAELRLTMGPANVLTLLFVSLTQNPVSTLDGTLVPDISAHVFFPIGTNADGAWELTMPGGNGPLDVYVQDLLDDAGATFGVGFSNALKLQFQM